MGGTLCGRSQGVLRYSPTVTVVSDGALTGLLSRPVVLCGRALCGCQRGRRLSWGVCGGRTRVSRDLSLPSAALWIGEFLRVSKLMSPLVT